MKHFKFTYKDHWCHISQREMYEAYDNISFKASVEAFRKRHSYYGTLLVFESDDSIEWKFTGEVEGDKKHFCEKCKKYPEFILSLPTGNLCEECFMEMFREVFEE